VRFDLNSNNELLLIKAFKKGDEKAFELLFEKYHRKLYSYIYSMLQSKEDAEEIVQEAFIKIWEKRELYNEDYPFNSFLFKIAKNAFLNSLRKKVNRKVTEENWDILIDAHTKPADEYLIYEETRGVIEAVIGNLPPKRKEIFKMRRIDGMSRSEIAESLGISIITVDSQLMKAYRYMREELKRKCVLVIFVAFNFLCF
jgi:RNA polymerase sigma-70 factor (family 1)